MSTVEELLQRAGAQGLRLIADGSRLDESGADFRVLQAHDEQGVAWIVREPRRPDVLARAAGERKVLELVRSRLNVAVPEWRIYTPELIAYPRLGGEPSATIGEAGYVWRLDETQPPEAFLDSLAKFLAELHAIAPQDALDAGLLQRSNDEVRATYAAQMEHARAVLKISDAVWARWHTWLEDQVSWPEHRVLVHGDLHPPHVLIDGDAKVTGILDWTEAHLGDAATDFALFYAALGEKTLGVLLEKYAAHGGRRWPAMTAHIAAMWSAYPVIIADFAASSGQEGPLGLAQMLIDVQTAT